MVREDYENVVQLCTCDWLQFHGDCTWAADGLPSAPSNYKTKPLNHGTRIFAEVVEVYEKSTVTKSHRDELLLTVAYKPHSSVLKKTMYIAKVANKVLYQDGLYMRVSSALRVLGLTYEGITRFDVCIDFHDFACPDPSAPTDEPRALHPLRLLKMYRKNRFVKYGSRSYSDWRTAPFTASQLSATPTHDELSAEHVTHCVTWGGATSDVHVKMYNKTHELKECGHKRYIPAFWRANGLNTSRDVWRVEISVTRRSKYLFDNSSGDVVPVNLELVCKQSFRNEIFAAYAHRYFRWKFIEPGVSRKYAKDLRLFVFHDDKVFSPAAPESKPIAGRTTKVAANHIENIVKEVDFEIVFKGKPYAKEVLEIAHETLCELYDGLVMMQRTPAGKPRPSKAELLEKMEWLRSWNMLPAEIDGVETWRIEDIYEGNARAALMEEIELRKKEAEAHMMWLAMSGE